MPATFNGRFEGRTAIVTGGGSGIGQDVAARLAREGAVVCLWDRDQESMRRAQRSCGAAATFALDVSDPAQVETAMAASAAALGGQLDVLVCSAGIMGPVAPVRDYPVEAWQRVMDVNLNGLFYCNRAALPWLERSGVGRIVNVASVAGKEGIPNAAAYSASKAAVIGLTKSLGKELATTAIRVNCVAPAGIRTAILDQVSEDYLGVMLSRIPVGRFGTLGEATSLIAWLASDECSFSTGAVFDLSGGRATY